MFYSILNNYYTIQYRTVLYDTDYTIHYYPMTYILYNTKLSNEIHTTVYNTIL